MGPELELPGERGEDLADAAPESREIIAALEDEGQPSRRGPLGQAQQGCGQAAEAAGRHGHPAEGVARGDVKAGADDDELRLELGGDRSQDPLEDVEIVGVGLPCEQRDIEVEAVAFAVPQEASRSGPG